MSTSNSHLYDLLHVIPNSDGSLTRLKDFHPILPASLSSKDVPLNPDHSTWIRLYLPRDQISPTGSDPPTKKLPIMVFVHGGGFVVGSVGTPPFHEFCDEAASRLGALVVSIEYRLAPEHRLPAAYDDVLEALTWVKEGRDEWVKQYGDLSRCVLVGESAGGNIVYHSGLLAAEKVDQFQPLNIKGLVLIQPYFGGPNRTGSEVRLVNNEVVPVEVLEFMWELGLPVGANRSHEYCDPMVGGGSRLLERVKDLGWRVGVIASDGDPLYDRDVELAKLMENRGVSVQSMSTKDDPHGAFVSDSTNKRKDVLDLIMDFLS